MSRRRHPAQGEVYHVDLPEAGEHFIIVAAEERFNRGYSLFGVPITSQFVAERGIYDTSTVFDLGSYPFFEKQCVAQAEMMDRIRHERFGSAVGILNANDVNRVLTAIAAVFGVTHGSDID